MSRVFVCCCGCYMCGVEIFFCSVCYGGGFAISVEFFWLRVCSIVVAFNDTLFVFAGN